MPNRVAITGLGVVSNIGLNANDFWNSLVLGRSGIGPITTFEQNDDWKTRIAGEIAAKALDEVAKIAKPGTRTDEIDRLCFEFINDHGAFSAPLYYRGFPKSCCTSANHVVCHGIPSDKVLKEGDIINVDVTALKDTA